MLNKLYKSRFSANEIAQKKVIWGELCGVFFNRYIRKDSVLIDLGAGYGEFINAVKCKEKYALDLNDETAVFLSPEVKFFKIPVTDLSPIKDSVADVVFASNILEHLETKESLFKCLSEVRRVLKKGGRLIVMGPNMRYVYREYWDFIDHRLPLSDKSIVEILQMLDFEIEQVYGQFLPYTTKSWFPKNAFFIRCYLRMPFIWKIFGKQMLVIAKKSDTTK